MPEEQIEEIKNAVRAISEILINRTEPLTDDIKSELALVLEHAANRIQELRKQQQQEAQALEQPQIPPLTPGPFPSSNINAFKYDPESQKLFVKFQDKYPQQNGPVYSYEGVPKFIFDVFSRGAVGPKTSGSNKWHRWRKGVTPSLGAAMAALVKNGGYQYKRLS